MTQEMIHELIFDFVNGKTKSFDFRSKEEAAKYLDFVVDQICIQNADLIVLSNTVIILNHVCSIRINSYPKPKEEE